jgi:spermidine synthase
MTRSRTLVFALLLMSGFTGLVYELAWSKRLANLLGNSGQAHAVVLATFMGGLALGAWLFGRVADRSKRPLQLYGWLELGVGASALLFPSVLEVLGRIWLSVAPDLGDTARTISRLLLASLALLVPTLLMGGTLPAVTRYVTERLETARRDLSLLYAVNSLGAAIGCLAAGFVLVPEFGLVATERVAAGLNGVLGVLALLLGRQALSASPASAPVVGEALPAVWDNTAVRAALLGTAIAGFTSMLYEITWIRVLAVVIGGTSYSFTLILTTFILGISLGSFWLSRRPDVDALGTFSRLQLALVGAVCLTLPFYEQLPFRFIQLNGLLQHKVEAWPLYQVVTFVFCGAVLLVPTFMLGASFPAAARVAMRAFDAVGAQLGNTYLANTIGTVSGSLLGGLVLLPTIGLEGNFAVGLVCNLLAAGVSGAVAWRGAPMLKRVGPVVVAALCVGVWGASTRGWALTVASSGRYREWHRTFSSFSQFRREVRERSGVKFYRDDVFASVLIGEQGGKQRYLRINGKTDASNGGDTDTQILLGQLGMLTAPHPVKKVLMIGVGTGITAGSLLTHPLEQLDVVDISPAVIEGVKYFEADTHDAFHDPRCHVYVEDARTFLTLSHEKYDLIVSEPSNPWVSGVAGLYSQDFFRVAREKLAPDGRVVQWIHTYESSPDLIRLVVRTLRDSFEHGTTWVGPDDLVMIGTREPQVVDVAQMEARMAIPTVASDLDRIGIHFPATLLARQLQSDQGQLAFAGQGPVNTDDRNRLEYGSPVAYFVEDTVDVPDERRAPTWGRGLELERWRTDHPLTLAEVKDLYGSLSVVHPLKDTLVRATAERWLELDPTSVDAAVAVARSAIEQGNTTVAQRLLAPIVAGGERAAAVLIPFLIATRSQVKREAASWRPVAGCEQLEAGRQAVAITDDERDDLAEALSRLEAACR